MRKTHDLESMLFVLKLFEPKSRENTALTNWWKENIRDRISSEGIFNLIDALKGFNATDDRVGLKSDVDVKNPAGTHPPGNRRLLSTQRMF